jgi:hypothetical protein
MNDGLRVGDSLYNSTVHADDGTLFSATVPGLQRLRVFIIPKFGGLLLELRRLFVCVSGIWVQFLFRMLRVWLFLVVIIIIICDTYRALPRTHAVKALLPIRFSKKPSLQLPLEGLIVLKWHEMLWQLVSSPLCKDLLLTKTLTTNTGRHA